MIVCKPLRNVLQYHLLSFVVAQFYSGINVIIYELADCGGKKNRFSLGIICSYSRTSRRIKCYNY